MHEHVTLLAPDSPSAPRRSSTLPPDLLEQVRGRVRLLALLLFIIFGFEPLLYSLAWIAGAVAGIPVTFGNRGFALADLSAAIASAALWWAAREGHSSPARLHTLGLCYQVVICFMASFTTMWQWYLGKGSIPPLTLVPMIVGLFPLIMPGAPRRMLTAAIVAASMSPLALLLLDLLGKVHADGDDYLRAIVGPAIAVGFAYLGARVIYGLGREVAEARELGSYQLEALLGQGGMGEVWRARHRMLARPAAIKLIRPSHVAGEGALIPEQSIRRFEQEAQAIARLRSPHTVELFDFGVSEQGAFYYVMELLDGLDADSLVRRFGPLPAERVVYLLRQVCHSLSEAESCGLVHRDIKPANIFLCRYGEDCDFVKVLDFGLVKAHGDAGEASPALTRENAVQGTPAFIAPEQALGEARIDGRADIYATGCVAYWMLTGQLVFASDTAMGLVLQHVQSPPTPPSTRTTLPIPAGLERLVLSCLAKDPAERPQSARALWRCLAEVDVVNEWTDERAREWWTEHCPQP